MNSLCFGALAVLFLFASSTPASVWGQEPLLVIRDEQTLDFPNAITFEMRASPPTAIENAEVRYRVDSVSCGSAVATGIASPPQPSAGEANGKTAAAESSSEGAFAASWEWDLRESGGLPVGASVTYRWLLSGGGRVFETEERTFVYEDPRHDWRVLDGGRVTLRWSNGDEAFARDLLETADAAVERLSESTGVTPDRKIGLRIYESAEALRDALVFPGDYTGGVAYPSYGLTAIGISPRNVVWGRRAIAHELTHVVIGQAAFACGADIPAWLHEGLAVYNEGPLQSDFERSLSSAIEEKRVFRLGSIAGAFPADEEGITLSYAQSWSVANYLIETYGADRMNALLTAFRATGSIEQALTEAYGFGRQGLENRWRASLGLPELPPLTVPTPRLREIPPLTLPTPNAPAPATSTLTAAATPTPSAAATPTSPASGAGCNSSGGAMSGLDGTLAALLIGGAAASLRRTV